MDLNKINEVRKELNGIIDGTIDPHVDIIKRADDLLLEIQESQLQSTTVLGINFRRMTDRDFEGFAGADEGSWIAIDGPNIVTLLLSPDRTTIYEIAADLEFNQREWKLVNTI